MEMLDIQPSKSTPKIHFDTKEKILTLTGESYPENSFEFYAPVLSWLKDYLKIEKNLRIDITISYMNSSSIKCIFDIFDIVEETWKKGGDFRINWFYDSENPRSFDLAEEFSEEVHMPFHIIAIEN
jgi:hypothetical protein